MWIKEIFSKIKRKFAPINQREKHNVPVTEMPKEEDKLDAEKTMLGLIIASVKTPEGIRGNYYPFITDNSNICVKKEDDIITLMIPTVDITKLNIPFEELENVNFIVDHSNDPTHDMAGCIISIGYSVLRHTLTHAKITCFNPLTLTGEEKNFIVNFTRPTRPLYETKEQLMYEELMPKIKKEILSSIVEVGNVNPA